MRKTGYGCVVLVGLMALAGAVQADPPGDMRMHGGMMKPGMGAHGDMMRPGMGMHGDMKRGGGHGMRMGGCGDEGFDAGMMSMHVLAALDLDAGQRKQIMELRRELRKDVWDLKRQVIDQREQLGMLYGADTLDVAAIKSAYQKLFDVKLKTIENSLKFKQELFKVLSPEQRQRLMHGAMGGSDADDEMEM